MKVGIVGPCPPPFGGVTRILENHLRCWEDKEIDSFLIPFDVPDEPQVFHNAHLMIADRQSSMLQFVAAVFRVGWRFGICRWSSFKKLIEFDIHLRRVIRQEKLDIIYCHHADMTGLIAVKEANDSGIPVVLTVYGEAWLAVPHALRWKRAIQFSVRHADQVVSTSEHCRQGAIARGANPENASVIYAGIDLERFHREVDGKPFRDKLGIPHSAIVISVLGLALRRKLDTMLDAIELMENDREVHFLIGGVGHDARYLEDRIQMMPQKRARALGFVSEAELPSFYAATDILVVAPNTIVECMGQSMKEAMSVGKPVVGARLGGVPEALGNEVCGLMFEPDDPKDLCKKLKSLIDDPTKRATLGSNGRREAEKRFDAKASADQMYNLLAKCVRASIQ